MPVTPFLTVPNTPRSHKTYTNDECRQNAMRIRQENDWFGHSDGPARAATNGQKSPRYSNEQHRIVRPSSAKWWNEDVEISRGKIFIFIDS